MATPRIVIKTQVDEDDHCDSQEEISFDVGLEDMHETSHKRVITNVSTDSVANARKNLWHEEMVGALVEEVEKQPSFLRLRAAQQQSTWMEITNIMKLYNPNVTWHHVKKKWHNILGAIRRYEESVRWGERGRIMQPLFYDRIKAVIGDSERRYDRIKAVVGDSDRRYPPLYDSLPEMSNVEVSQKEVSKPPSRIPQKEPLKLVRQKLIADVLGTLAQACNVKRAQNSQTESDTDSSPENEQHSDEDSHWQHAVPAEKYRKLNHTQKIPSTPATYISPHKCRFRDEWCSVWPFIKKGGTPYQYWCDICKMMDSCDSGTDAVLQHIRSSFHNEKMKAYRKKMKGAADGKSFKAVSKSSVMSDHMSSPQVETRSLDIKALKHMISAKPEIVDRTIIVSVDVKTKPRSSTDMVKDILSVIGEANVEEIDVVTKTFIIVTLQKGSENLMDAVRMIRYYDIFNMIEILYTLHFPHAIEATVEGILEGLPRLISSTQLPHIKEIVNQLYPFLTDITVDYMPWSGTSLISGNIRVKALVDDLKSSYQRLKSPREIRMGVFTGKLTLDTFKIINKHVPENFPSEVRSDITILKW